MNTHTHAWTVGWSGMEEWGANFVVGCPWTQRSDLPASNALSVDWKL